MKRKIGLFHETWTCLVLLAALGVVCRAQGQLQQTSAQVNE
jgi:hypothetical protein